MSKNVAYLRVSTVDQDLEKNKSEILFLANGYINDLKNTNTLSLASLDNFKNQISKKIFYQQIKDIDAVKAVMKNIETIERKESQIEPVKIYQKTTYGNRKLC